MMIRIKTCTVIYELKIRTSDLDEASVFAEGFDEECRKKARLVSVQCEEEWWDVV